MTPRGNSELVDFAGLCSWAQTHIGMPLTKTSISSPNNNSDGPQKLFCFHYNQLDFLQDPNASGGSSGFFKWSDTI